MAKKTYTPTEIDWYRVKIPADKLKELNERSDLEGWQQAGGFLLTMCLTGGASYYAYTMANWWLFGLLLFAHGTVCAFCISAVHELSHNTVFKTRWLNVFFNHLFGFIGWNNNRFFWCSHAMHHRYTLHPDDDQEVIVPMYHSIKNFVIGAVYNFWHWRMSVKPTLMWAMNKPMYEWFDRVCDDEGPDRERVVSWSRWMIAGHALIIGVSLYFGNWAIPLIVSLTPFYGGWLFLLCNNTQHAGLIENVNDFRLNCRTMYNCRLVRFLYWHMNWHIEHHMYAAVPCYKLAKLHEAIKHELPHTPNGLLETWTEICYIMYRQGRDSSYRYIPELPNNEGTRPSNLSRLEQIRQQADRSLAQKQARKEGPNRRWECEICGFIYEEARGMPEEGIAPGTAWEDIPEDWSCPDCGVSKAEFEMVEIKPATPQAA